jgi:hypothetical protein
LGIHRQNLGVAAALDTNLLAATDVMQHISSLVASGPGSIRAGHVRTWHQHTRGMILLIQDAKTLQLLPHGLVKGPARSIVARDDDGVLWTGSISLRNRRDPVLRIRERSC